PVRQRPHPRLRSALGSVVLYDELPEPPISWPDLLVDCIHDLLMQPLPVGLGETIRNSFDWLGKRIVVACQIYQMPAMTDDVLVQRIALRHQMLLPPELQDGDHLIDPYRDLAQAADVIFILPHRIEGCISCDLRKGQMYPVEVVDRHHPILKLDVPNLIFE